MATVASKRPPPPGDTWEWVVSPSRGRRGAWTRPPTCPAPPSAFIAPVHGLRRCEIVRGPRVVPRFCSSPECHTDIFSDGLSHRSHVSGAERKATHAFLLAMEKPCVSLDTSCASLPIAGSPPPRLSPREGLSPPVTYWPYGDQLPLLGNGNSSTPTLAGLRAFADRSAEESKQ